MSAVGTSSPQKLLEAFTALFVKDLAAKCLKNLNRVSSDTITCAAQKFTYNLQAILVNPRDSIRRFR